MMNCLAIDMTWLSAILPDSPAVTLAVVAWSVILIWGTNAVTRWMTPEPDVPPPDTVRESGPMDWEDLIEPSLPEQVTVYDTSDTRTECVEVPTWLSSPSPQDTSGQTEAISTAPFSDSSRRTANLPTSDRKPLGGTRYAITPLIQGSPTLSVGSEQVVLSSYVRGQGRTWTYDVPQDTWSIGVDGHATVSRQWLQATTTLGVARSTKWGAFDIQPRIGVGYGALVTDTYHAGPVMRAGLSIEYRW